MKRRRHTPEQIIRKLREAERLLADSEITRIRSTGWWMIRSLSWTLSGSRMCTSSGSPWMAASPSSWPSGPRRAL